MATQVAAITAQLRADIRDFDAKMGKAERRLGGVDRAGRNTSATMGKMGPIVAGAAAVAGAAIAKFAVSSVNDFAAFEKGMNEVFTLLPDISEKAMGEVTGQVKDLAVEMGVLPDKVVPALYQAISAGVPQENVFTFLEIASKASIGGVTELETAVDGITSVVNAYGKETITAGRASDLMFTAVRLGKTTFEELARFMFQVNPVAAGLGIAFSNVTAALAALTAQGVPTRVATTQIRQALVELGKSGTIASDAFMELSGQTFADFIAKGGDVKQAFDIMKQGADNMGVGVGDLFSSVEASMAVIALTSDVGAKKFGDAMGEMQDAAGATEEAFDRMDDGVSRNTDKLQAKFAVLKIEAGEKLAPALLDLVEVGEDLVPTLVLVTQAAADLAAGIVDMAKPTLDIIAFLGEFGAATGDADEGTSGMGHAVNMLTRSLMMSINPTAALNAELERYDKSAKGGAQAVTDLTQAQLDAKRAAYGLGGQVHVLNEEVMRPYILRTLAAKGATQELLDTLSGDVDTPWALTVGARIQGILDKLDLLAIWSGRTPSRGGATTPSEGVGNVFLHSGGVVGGKEGTDEVLAVLQRGEGVIDRDTMNTGVATGGGDTFILQGSLLTERDLEAVVAKAKASRGNRVGR